jgi:hypothetical protein
LRLKIEKCSGMQQKLEGIVLAEAHINVGIFETVVR